MEMQVKLNFTLGTRNKVYMVTLVTVMVAYGMQFCEIMCTIY